VKTHTTGAHIDAETLAAWTDHGLSADASADVELHLSQCDRCQEMLAAFVRGEPVPATVIPFWSRRPVQWSAAGLAAAAALVAMMWIGRPPSVPAPAAIVASAPQVQPVEPIPPQPSSSSAPADVRADKPSAKVSAPVEQRASPPPFPLVTPAVTIGAAAPAVAPAAERIPAMAESVMFDTRAVIEIVSPDRTVLADRAPAGAGRGGAGVTGRSRWRIVGGTRVERSMDAGATWTTLPIEPAVPSPIMAGVSTSSSVCWLVGADGLVLLTTDGQTFRRVPFPERAPLVSVTAADALRATVTSSDGRTFATVDGGLTWK